MKFSTSIRSFSNLFCIFTLLLVTFQVENIEIPHSVNTQNYEEGLNQKNNKQDSIKDIKICDGNRFEFISSYVLSRQSDLTQTFQIIQKFIQLKNITFSDRPGRIYKIYNFKPALLYLQSKQAPPQIKSMNVLNISGGYLRMTYNFDWSKQQIGQSINGSGTGVVSSDSISYEKSLQTNETHELQWVFRKANPITITNSLTLKTIDPFKDVDYQIINQMLNELPKNESTVKTQLINKLNINFTAVLKNIIIQDETLAIPKVITYDYNDYRGDFSITFDNVLIQNSLSKNGLSLILSQVIQNDLTFQCGKKVPEDPDSISRYGGNQQYISNTFFKSALKYALLHRSLDVTLSQDNWQSRAFQFFIGDLHQPIVSTKKIPSYASLNGKCQASTDNKSFSIDYKSISSYAVKVNFTCYLQLNGSKIVDFVLPVQYEITPILTNKELNFVIQNINGTPKFIQNPKYNITNTELAQFMLIQTLKIAVKSEVIGSGYKTKSRKNPQLQVRPDYLFLYDKSSIKQIDEL